MVAWGDFYLIKIYDLNHSLTAILENAFAIGYEKKLNELWTATFSLPADDAKNAYCQPFYYAEIFDGDERVDLFRIINSEKVYDDNSEYYKYDCEHVLDTLLDSVIHRSLQTTNLYTADVIETLLEKQDVKHWQSGRTDFAYAFSYNWSNTNILSALFSITKPFLVDYMWTWDTTSYPWTLNLVELDTTPSAYVRRGKNLRGFTKEIDTSELCTRLYCLGYGDGDNQLGIENFNNGIPYIDADPETIDKYGIISRTYVDKSYESPIELYNAGLALLEKLKVPRITYTVNVADIYILTGDPNDLIDVGKMIDVYDEEAGEHVQVRVVGVSKSDVYGNPGDMTVTLANKYEDITDEIASLTERQLINDLYAQGATNIDSHDFADNADPDHPAVVKFVLPEETVRLNKAYLTASASAFRGYSRATKGGGATTQTTSSGGGTTQTTSAGGGTTKTTSSGGGTTRTTTGGGEHSHLMFQYDGSADPFGDNFTTYYAGVHGGGAQLVAMKGQADDLWTYDSAGYHTHSVDIPDHTHSVTIPDHTHSVTIPNHTHTVTIPNHTHDIDYGIYEGPTPSKLTIIVDGNTVGDYSSVDQLDIIPYLEKDSDGKVTRGEHTIQIKPNDLGRITASVVTQFFIQSRGGGDY